MATKKKAAVKKKSADESWRQPTKTHSAPIKKAAAKKSTGKGTGGSNGIGGKKKNSVDPQMPQAWETETAIECAADESE